MECTIRKWSPDDSAELAKNLSDPEVLKNLREGPPYPYTEKDAAEYIAAMLSADGDKTYAFAVSLDGKCIGSIAVFRRDNIHRRTAELGYYIGREYWGHGYMTCAVKQLCSYIFENTDIIRIFAEPFSRNAASCRVLEKAGFSCEGTLRANAEKAGEIIDMKMYAIVKEP